ncbi:MAG: glycoside hydrolase family 16 protein, partial [Clostridia bacterium]|nr:glycoside hydrolase family 16 protein [Clostridia bacterium]
MKEYKVEGHISSYLPGEKNWKLVWNDEFDGTQLDTTKWGFRRYFWGKLSPTFTDEGVEFCGDSTMKINLIKKGDDYFSAHLQTGSLTFDIPPEPEFKNKFWRFGTKEKPKFMHKFGYYEIRCKLPKNPGWHAAFWLQAPGIGTHPDPAQCGVECDIMENYLQHTKGEMICGNGWNGYGAESTWYGHFHFPYEETADGWHTYAVDWSKAGYIFYADGKEVGRQMAPECAVSEVEQFILVSTECHGYNRGFAGDSADSDEKSTLAGDVGVWKGKPVEELKSAVLPD